MADYIAELRRLILIWQFSEQLLDSNDPARRFYTQAIDAALGHIIEHAITEN